MLKVQMSNFAMKSSLQMEKNVLLWYKEYNVSSKKINSQNFFEKIIS